MVTRRKMNRSIVLRLCVISSLVAGMQNGCQKSAERSKDSGTGSETKSTLLRGNPLDGQQALTANSHMADETEIRALVEEYIRQSHDWAQQHRPKNLFDSEELQARLEVQKKASDKTFDKYCINRTIWTKEYFISEWPGEHNPEQEKVTSVRFDSISEAFLETKVDKGGFSSFHEYILLKSQGAWRIGGIRTYFSDEGERVDELDLPAFSPNIPVPIAIEKLPEGLEKLFKGPARLRSRYDIAITELVSAGVFEAPSGIIGCDDAGQWASGMKVFEMKIPPGKHPVELVVQPKFGMVGAARIIFDINASAKSYALATRASKVQPRVSSGPRESSNVIGVDTGMVGLVDALALSKLSKRQRERHYWKVVEASDAKPAKGAWSISTEGGSEALVIHSGAGDGGYPAFWVLDAEGKPVSLIFDFMDLAQSIYEETEISLNGNSSAIVNDRLKKERIHVEFGREQGHRTLNVVSQEHVNLEIYGNDRELLFKSEGAGCSIVGEQTTYVLPSTIPSNLSGHIKVQWYKGHRYEFVE
jgi:hypothetical protein